MRLLHEQSRNMYILDESAPVLPTTKILSNIDTDDPNAPFSILHHPKR